ncbi:hypothetical protein BGW36DRAFT_425604 [Talaromyces proteolyticus]|uniref:Transcription factor domain-containing protein n=1 Tax=Talaromyces proteolyticus TaxID=1131652 RepID=A0AAD4KTX8_9EURO|nr:uncharacterized protein BGW36DRAFT_425604 [Talaromyces proteolyticus]KAH8700798.1 hypothetical protein BGW36DRAFT_425604 [Talaromyces proteolyticus]
MNKDEVSSGRGGLNGFYSYKNTFDEDSVWLEIPKEVIFVDNSDPDLEELEASLLAADSDIDGHHTNGWGHEFPLIDQDSHGLSSLSNAATQSHYTFHDSVGTPTTDNSRISLSHSNLPAPAPTTISSPNKSRGVMPPPASPSVSITSSNNNINFLLNPSSSMSPPIESRLTTPLGVRDPSYTPNATTLSRNTTIHSRSEPKVESSHEVAFLLRHFAEGPGYWMDLFDIEIYFSSLVPVKALSNPLLKYAACAYAAKQLSRVQGSKPVMGGRCSKQASIELWPDAEKVDWEWYGAKYYDKAIQLLMKELQHDAEGPAPLSTLEAFGQWEATELSKGGEPARKRRRRSSNSRFSSSHSDEVLAATAILSVYEFLDATGSAWNRHLSGVKSLLDIAEVGMMPLEQEKSPGGSAIPRKGPERSLRTATFWNFARQDYLAACKYHFIINECQTRLNPEDLLLWTEAGLQVDSHGFVRPSNTDEESIMREDMISNALIWLLSKIVNFIGAGDQIHLTPTGNPAEQGPIGVSQNTLLERWYQLHLELDAWYNGLPDTFKPCARLEPTRIPHQLLSDTEHAPPFPEIWYSMPMCASTMQHYHMARILLLINKPHESTARRTTVTDRLRSYRSIESEVRFHSREICSISMSRMDASARIHSLQPLFVSGQCLTELSERQTIVELLRSIEADTGWATEYRVKQLLREWGWDEANTV